MKVSRDSSQATKNTANATTETVVSSLVPRLEHLNATQIFEFFERQPLVFDNVPSLFPGHDVEHHDMIAVYSRKARLKLHDMLTSPQQEVLSTTRM